MAANLRDADPEAVVPEVGGDHPDLRGETGLLLIEDKEPFFAADCFNPGQDEVEKARHLGNAQRLFRGLFGGPEQGQGQERPVFVHHGLQEPLFPAGAETLPDPDKRLAGLLDIDAATSLRGDGQGQTAAMRDGDIRRWFAAVPDEQRPAGRGIGDGEFRAGGPNPILAVAAEILVQSDLGADAAGQPFLFAFFQFEMREAVPLFRAQPGRTVSFLRAARVFQG